MQDYKEELHLSPWDSDWYLQNILKNRWAFTNKQSNTTRNKILDRLLQLGLQEEDIRRYFPKTFLIDAPTGIAASGLQTKLKEVFKPPPKEITSEAPAKQSQPQSISITAKDVAREAAAAKTVHEQLQRDLKEGSEKRNIIDVVREEFPTERPTDPEKLAKFHDWLDDVGTIKEKALRRAYKIMKNPKKYGFVIRPDENIYDVYQAVLQEMEDKKKLKYRHIDLYKDQEQYDRLRRLFPKAYNIAPEPQEDSSPVESINIDEGDEWLGIQESHPAPIPPPVEDPSQESAEEDPEVEVVDDEEAAGQEYDLDEYARRVAEEAIQRFPPKLSMPGPSFLPNTDALDRFGPIQYQKKSAKPVDDESILPMEPPPVPAARKPKWHKENITKKSGPPLSEEVSKPSATDAKRKNRSKRPAVQQPKTTKKQAAPPKDPNRDDRTRHQKMEWE